MSENIVRPYKKKTVFRVTQPNLNLLLKLGFFLEFFLCILKGEMPFKMHTIIYLKKDNEN